MSSATTGLANGATLSAGSSGNTSRATRIPPVFTRFRQRRVIHQLTSGGVHEVRPGLHPAEDRIADRSSGFIVQRKVHAHDVTLRRYLLRRLKDSHVRGRCSAMQKSSAPDDNRHPEASGAARHLLPDAAEPEQS